MHEPTLKLDYPQPHIARVTFDQPGSRANTLSRAVQGEWEAMLDQLEANRDLQGVLLVSAKPGMFIAGADLKELADSTPNSESSRAMVERFSALQARLEKLPCPTAALIDGSCVGGGLELVLAFDYRIVGTHPKAELGLPETKIGLIPGWGGTQRLSRVVGPSIASEWIVAGDLVSAEKAKAFGLVFDRVPSERLLAEGLRVLAWSLASDDWRSIRIRMQRPVGLSEDQHAFTFASVRAQAFSKTRGQLPAPLAAVDAIAEGCNLPLEDALRVEAKYFLPLVGSPISKNLIAVFFMNQRLGKDPGVADATIKPAEIGSVAVLGAGLMGAGIAGAHLRKNLPTLMRDVSREALDQGVASITKVLQARVGIGRMTQAEMLTALSHLHADVAMDNIRSQDLIVEAVVENEDVKTSLLRDLSSRVRPEAILASNTSTISITRLALAVDRPERFAGLHFFNPVDRMALVEVIRGDKTDDATTATLVAHAKKLGKTPIVVRDCPGFLVNRVLFPYLNEAMVLLEAGVSARAIDVAAEAFGMPMGPLALADLVGLDTTLFATEVLHRAFADRSVRAEVLDRLVASKRLGKKSGAGFYSYAKDSRGADDPTLATFLPRGVPSHPMSADAIMERLFLPMLVEASRVLDEGIVRSSADLDMGLILGLGFPSHRGGLLRWADSLGIVEILRKLAKHESLGPRFEATPTLRRMLQEGTSFFA